MRWILSLLLASAIILPSFMGSANADTAEYSVEIVEVLPDPAGSDIEGEFIELINMGDTPANLLNWSLTDQDGPPDLIFPDITLQPGERLVAHVGAGENLTENGTIHLYMWKTSSMLNNGGDDVLLLDGSGNPVDYMAYGNGSMVDQPPEGIEWDESMSAVSGLSLARSSDTGAWFSAMPTPGKENPDADAGEGAVVRSFYPYARASDEFVEISNPSNSPIDISGCYITDGEGYAYFPSETVVKANSSIYLTQNGSGFFGEMGFPADISYDDCYTPSSYPRFANSGDEIMMCKPSGATLFSVSYGDGSELQAPKKGEIYRYEDGWKAQKIGRSSFSPLTLSFNGSVSVFTAPESSLKAVKNEIERAEKEIIINVYEFRSQEIAQELLGAIARGVRVRILVEGNPVGGISDAETKVLRTLWSAGADIRLEVSNASAGRFQRYNYDHAKYMIVDSGTLFIDSENFNGEAMKTDGKSGNRGWGIVIRNESAARYMRRIFFEDSNLNFSDIVKFDALNLKDPNIQWKPFPDTSFEPVNLNGTFNITLLPGPESGLDEIIGAINSADSSVYVEQFYITPRWRYGDESVQSPLISALFNASLRGCEVKVLLDSFYYNTDGNDDNDELAEYLNSFGAENSVNIQARLIDLSAHDLVKVHNKGMIIDGRTTLISSFNWGQNSFTNNREMAVMVENKQVGEYFNSLFLEDWKSDFNPPVAVIEGERDIQVNVSSVFSASSSYDDSGISAYQWFLDDSNISVNSSIRLNFTAPGEHMLTLAVYDKEGNSNETSIKLAVLPEDVKENATEQKVWNEVSEVLPSVDDSAEDSTRDTIPPKNEPQAPAKSAGSIALWEYLLLLPAVAVLVSAIRISGRKEKGKNHGS